MHVVVCGSRTIKDHKDIYKILSELHSVHNFTLLLSGNALGVDRIAENWATENNISIQQHIPDWKQYGKGAGVVRNKEMIEKSSMVIAFWDGKSNGTKHAIETASKHNKVLKIIKVAT